MSNSSKLEDKNVCFTAHGGAISAFREIYPKEEVTNIFYADPARTDGKLAYALVEQENAARKKVYCKAPSRLFAEESDGNVIKNIYRKISASQGDNCDNQLFINKMVDVCKKVGAIDASVLRELSVGEEEFASQITKGKDFKIEFKKVSCDGVDGKDVFAQAKFLDRADTIEICINTSLNPYQDTNKNKELKLNKLIMVYEIFSLLIAGHGKTVHCRSFVWLYLSARTLSRIALMPPDNKMKIDNMTCEHILDFMCDFNGN